jgi:tRNA(Arg) A34 adenosine deaminase TadA
MASETGLLSKDFLLAVGFQSYSNIFFPTGPSSATILAGLPQKEVHLRFLEMALHLPGWVESYLPDPDEVYLTVEDRMRLVVGLAGSDVDHGTSGPFGAAIFDLHTNRLVAPGVNLVIAANCAIVHAAMVEIMIAQRAVGDFDLGGEGQPPHELVTSAEPCGMCLGAISWSSVRHLVCGSRNEDAYAIGFDEGPEPPGWISELERRGISVVGDELRDEAAAALRRYAEEGGVIYNGRQGGQA